MKLSELIAKVGDDNVQFQNLDNDMTGWKQKDGVTQITFGTTAQVGVTGTQKLGLVVWLDREAVELATKQNPNKKGQEKS